MKIKRQHNTLVTPATPGRKTGQEAACTEDARGRRGRQSAILLSGDSRLLTTEDDQQAPLPAACGCAAGPAATAMVRHAGFSVWGCGGAAAGQTVAGCGGTGQDCIIG